MQEHQARRAQGLMNQATKGQRAKNRERPFAMRPLIKRILLKTENRKPVLHLGLAHGRDDIGGQFEGGPAVGAADGDGRPVSDRVHKGLDFL